MLQNNIAPLSAKIESLASGDDRLPIVAVVSRTEKYMVNVSSKAPTGAVDGAVKEVTVRNIPWRVGNNDKRCSQCCPRKFLGWEMEKQDFQVVFANNNLVQIDYLIYKYEFSSKGTKKIAKPECLLLLLASWCPGFGEGELTGSHVRDLQGHRGEPDCWSRRTT